MKKRAIILSVALLSLFLGVLTPQFAQDTPPPCPKNPDDPARRARAVALLRTINTAEAGEKLKNGSYADWPTLRAHHAAYFAQLRNPLGDPPEILPGWNLRLNVHADGQGYDVMIQDVAAKPLPSPELATRLPNGIILDPGCSRRPPAFYTNESVVIWEAAPI